VTVRKRLTETKSLTRGQFHRQGFLDEHPGDECAKRAKNATAWVENSYAQAWQAERHGVLSGPTRTLRGDPRSPILKLGNRVVQVENRKRVSNGHTEICIQ
jgi:hypothetical protein